MDKKTRYRATFYFEGQQYETASSVSQADAERKAALRHDRMKRGEIGLSPNMTVKRWAYEYLDTYKSDVSAQWKNDSKRRIDKLIVPALGNTKLKDVRDIQLQKIMNSLAGKSKSEVSKCRDLMKGMFRQARVSRLIIYDPSEELKAPAAEDGSHRSITEFERKHMEKVMLTHKAGLWVQLMLRCGLRPAETLALNWSHIDFDKKRVSVAFSMENITGSIKGPKTKAGIRSIPIPDDLLCRLEEYKRLRAESFRKNCSDDKSNVIELFSSQPVFVQERTGKRHTTSSRERMWESFLKELDVSMGARFEKRTAKDGKQRTVKVYSVIDEKCSDLRPYCLRHTYCTDLEEAGVPINVAAYLMGHANIHVTSRYYIHTRDKTIDSAAEKINKFNGNGNRNGKDKPDVRIS